MHEIHPPHSGTRSLREMLTHVGIIVVGLLIAVGIEHAVELTRERHLVQETRAALLTERSKNVDLWAVEKEHFLIVLAQYQTNLSILQHLRHHPGSEPATWPGALSYGSLQTVFSSSAWQVAGQSHVFEYMPASEVAHNTDLYRRLDKFNQAKLHFVAMSSESAVDRIEDADIAHYSPQQLERQIHSTAQVLAAVRSLGVNLRNLRRVYPDFASESAIKEIGTALEITTSNITGVNVQLDLLNRRSDLINDGGNRDQ